MIIGITGKAGSGKDTVADVLVAHFNFVKVALADPLKRICKEVFDFSDEQLWGPSEKRNEPDMRYPRRVRTFLPDPSKVVESDFLTPRHALQRLGTEWGRDCYKDVWVDYALRVARKVMFGQEHKTHDKWDYSQRRGLFPWNEGPMDDISGIVIPDVRYKNEADAIRKAGGTIWCITRPSAGLEGEAGKHSSETELVEIEADRTILNRADKVTLQHAIFSLMRDDLQAQSMRRYLEKEEESDTIPAPQFEEVALAVANLDGITKMGLTTDIAVEDNVDFEVALQPSVTMADGTQVLPDQPRCMDRLSGLLEERQRDVDAGKIRDYGPDQADVPPCRRKR